MTKYRVEIWDWASKDWIPIQDFIQDAIKENSAGLDPYRGLDLMHAQASVVVLAKKYPYLRFRVNADLG